MLSYRCLEQSCEGLLRNRSAAASARASSCTSAAQKRCHTVMASSRKAAIDCCFVSMLEDCRLSDHRRSLARPDAAGCSGRMLQRLQPDVSDVTSPDQRLGICVAPDCV